MTHSVTSYSRKPRGLFGSQGVICIETGLETVQDFVDAYKLGCEPSGLFVPCDSKPPMGIKARFVFRLRNGEQVFACIAQVSPSSTMNWSTKGIWLQFVTLSRTDLQMVQWLFASRRLQRRSFLAAGTGASRAPTSPALCPSTFPATNSIRLHLRRRSILVLAGFMLALATALLAGGL